ncbi:MAG TPA: hypothetical protein VF794_17040 [Archangium sp.]|uniref:hypothetical protein n=1 Tax=Archangium sp. TaxID=1872627 RepID=UPI002EDB64C2
MSEAPGAREFRGRLQILDGGVEHGRSLLGEYGPGVATPEEQICLVVGGDLGSEQCIEQRQLKRQELQASEGGERQDGHMGQTVRPGDRERGALQPAQQLQAEHQPGQRSEFVKT